VRNGLAIMLVGRHQAFEFFKPVEGGSWTIHEVQDLDVALEGDTGCPENSFEMQIQMDS
jgi:hypothetical protein